MLVESLVFLYCCCHLWSIIFILNIYNDHYLSCSSVQANHHGLLGLALARLAGPGGLLAPSLPHALDVQRGQGAAFEEVVGGTGLELTVAVELNLLWGLHAALALGDDGGEDAVHSQAVGGFLAERTHPTRIGGVGHNDQVVLQVEALEVCAEEATHGDFDFF